MPTNNYDSVKITVSGIHINGTYYTQEQFAELPDVAQEVKIRQSRSATGAALVAGTWWIPDVGQVVITTAGAILIAGATIVVGSWTYNAVKDWFATKAEITDAKAKIPERLKDDKGDWKIDKDTAGHKRSQWKLKDKQGKRVHPWIKTGKSQVNNI